MKINKNEESLVTGEVYHIFNKSIAEYMIFNDNHEFSRIREAIKYYRNEKAIAKLSQFIASKKKKLNWENFNKKDNLVNIVAYCIMPTHIHLALKQLKNGGISIFMSNVLNSYTRYFNTKHNRKGPLWESRFKRVLVDRDEQLIHLTRYIHLNPVTASLVNKPEDWHASSYREYLGRVPEEDKICDYSEILEINPEDYEEFTEERISYQKELARIKNLFLD